MDWITSGSLSGEEKNCLTIAAEFLSVEYVEKSNSSAQHLVK